MRDGPILVIGSINQDLVLETERVPRGGESLVGSSYHHVPGGKGANQAAAVAGLGSDVTFVGRVGDDAHGEGLREKLGGCGVNTEFLGVDSEEPTGLAVILLEAAGENRIIVYPGANLAIPASEIERAFECDPAAVLMTFETSIPTLLDASRIAREREVPLILDAGPAQSFDLSQLAGLEILSPNETEAEALCGKPCRTLEEAEVVARALAEASEARHVVIKLGERGSFVYSRGTAWHVPPFSVDVVDTTAAGDAFTAALTLRYLETGDLDASARFGNAAGALAATKLGAQPSMPTRAEVETLLAS